MSIPPFDWRAPLGDPMAAAHTAIKRRQRHHDLRCLPIIQEAKRNRLSVRATVRLLEAAGIPSPGGLDKWTASALWRVCKRLGIKLGYNRRKKEGAAV